MTIGLGDGWTLDSDERQWILGQEVTRKKEATGEMYADVKTVGYYRDLESDANAIGRKTAQKVVGESASLEDVLVALRNASQNIKETLEWARAMEILSRP